MTKASVIGAGRWGTFLAWYLSEYNRADEVCIYGLEKSKTFQKLRENRKNEYLSLQNNIKLTSNLEFTLQSDFIIISIDAQNLKFLATEISNYTVEGRTFILAMKGIDIEEKKRLSEIMFEKINQNINVAVLLGPGHVEDYTKGIPNCAVIDSNNKQTKDAVVNLMQSRLIRPYYGNDLIGNEIGGAYKNVIGIAAGMLDGLGYCSLKGALMSRSVFEVGKFIEKCGGNPRSASGLAFLGDFEATLFSQHSKNRMFGEMFVKDRNTKKDCEGYYTLKAVYEIGKDLEIDLPITNILYEIIYNNMPFQDGLKKLFKRNITKEF